MRSSSDPAVLRLFEADIQATDFGLVVRLKWADVSSLNIYLVKKKCFHSTNVCNIGWVNIIDSFECAHGSM